MANSQQKPVIGFAGMTHLGMVHASVAARLGFPVIAYHPTLWKPVPGEPDIETWFGGNPDAVTRTGAIDFLNNCDLVFLTLDVPLDADGCYPDYQPVRRMLDEAIPYLKEDAVLVIMSQVPPGFTRATNFLHERLLYQAETLVFGESVDRARFPERIIVGCVEPGNLPRVYHNYLRQFDCPILPMSYESAELTKMAINALLVSSIAMTNTLADVCEQVGADWSEIAPALRLDKRFGPHAYLTPGLGVGGGHIERDLYGLLQISEERAFDLTMLHAVLRHSNERAGRLARTINQQARGVSKIALLGLAYKPDTASTIKSPGMRLLQRLQLHNVMAHDPVVKHARSVDTVFECVDAADVLIIATPWPEYQKIKINDLKLHMRGTLIFDPYRVLDGEEAQKTGFEYHTLGAPPRFPA